MAQGSELRAQSTGHRAQGTEHGAQGSRGRGTVTGLASLASRAGLASLL